MEMEALVEIMVCKWIKFSANVKDIGGECVIGYMIYIYGIIYILIFHLVLERC